MALSITITLTVLSHAFAQTSVPKLVYSFRLTGDNMDYDCAKKLWKKAPIQIVKVIQDRIKRDKLGPKKGDPCQLAPFGIKVYESDSWTSPVENETDGRPDGTSNENYQFVLLTWGNCGCFGSGDWIDEVVVLEPTKTSEHKNKATVFYKVANVFKIAGKNFTSRYLPEGQWSANNITGITSAGISYALNYMFDDEPTYSGYIKYADAKFTLTPERKR